MLQFLWDFLKTNVLQYLWGWREVFETNQTQFQRYQIKYKHSITWLHTQNVLTRSLYQIFHKNYIFKHNMAWRINTNQTVQTQFEHFLSTHIVLKTLVTNLCFLATYFHLLQMMSYFPNLCQRFNTKYQHFMPINNILHLVQMKQTKTKMKLNNQIKQIKSPK